MPIQPGQKLSHYMLHEKIGEGGMGEVYRATDSTLGRDVAIKVLPQDVAGDPQRLARFQREAQVLASLNHPNIAAIHGLEKDAGTPFLVMELIEGEDLSERVRRGSLEVPEAVAIARQVAEALEEAHERGIVHRDLKPANIKLAPGGKVKVLDFGLAKAFDTAPAGQTDLSLSPTMTSAATQAGVILGTAAYMSPEQARGGTVDKRSDIWAFGCVLLEMLTGRGIFSADTLSDTLASVLKTEPEWEALPASIPPALTRLMKRCLEKDPRKRLRDIGEARILLAEDLSAPDPDIENKAEANPPGLGAKWIALMIAASMVLAAGLTAAVLKGFAGVPSSGVQKFEIVREGLQTDRLYAPALSPDARRVIFVRDNRLWIRDMDQIEPREMAGTEGAQHPFWSPGSDMIGYVKDGSLWKIPVQGGQAAAIAGGVGEFGPGAGISWGDQDRIVYSRGNSGLYEVSARGGDPRLLHDYDRAEESDLHEPSYLPDGRGVLMVAHRLASPPDTLSVLSGSERKVLMRLEGQGIRKPIYSPTGHILYLKQAANSGLWAVPFSVDTLELTGEPFLVAPDGSRQSVADDGTMLYVRGAGLGLRQLVWVSHQGVVQETIGQPQARIASPVVSPEGGRVAVMAQDNENWDIWIYDVVRGTRTRLTFTPLQDWDPAWTPDGSRVIFWDGMTRSISAKAADGTGEIESLVQEQFLDSGLPSISPDGKQMVFWIKTAEGRQDLYLMPMGGDSKPVPLIQGIASLDYPKISPGGDYLAYTSNESGRSEVFLTRFPSAEGRWQASTNGGQQAAWDPRGGRLYYRQDDSVMMVEVLTGSSLQLGSPVELFTAKSAGINFSGYNRFDVSHDGERFIMVRDVLEEGVEPSLVLVRNWLTEFERPE